MTLSGFSTACGQDVNGDHLIPLIGVGSSTVVWQSTELVGGVYIILGVSFQGTTIVQGNIQVTNASTCDAEAEYRFNGHVCDQNYTLPFYTNNGGFATVPASISIRPATPADFGGSCPCGLCLDCDTNYTFTTSGLSLHNCGTGHGGNRTWMLSPFFDKCCSKLQNSNDCVYVLGGCSSNAILRWNEGDPLYVYLVITLCACVSCGLPDPCTGAFPETAQIRYRIPKASWLCFGSNTLQFLDVTLISCGPYAGLPGITGYPAFITLTPA